jgi:hypothetical protein
MLKKHFKTSPLFIVFIMFLFLGCAKVDFKAPVIEGVKDSYVYEDEITGTLTNNSDKNMSYYYTAEWFLKGKWVEWDYNLENRGKSMLVHNADSHESVTLKWPKNTRPKLRLGLKDKYRFLVFYGYEGEKNKGRDAFGKKIRSNVFTISCREEIKSTPEFTGLKKVFPIKEKIVFKFSNISNDDLIYWLSLEKFENEKWNVYLCNLEEPYNEHMLSFWGSLNKKSVKSFTFPGNSKKIPERGLYRLCSGYYFIYGYTHRIYSPEFEIK